MTKQQWPIMTIAICFVCLTAYIVVNDFSYRKDTAYQDIQTKTYRAYLYWHRYISTLKGLILTTDGFGPTLDTAIDLQKRTRELIGELKSDSTSTDPEIREQLDAFIGSIDRSVSLGQEIIDNGYLFLAQSDLPSAYKEGRLGLSTLSGKDVTTMMGKLSANQYYQLIRKLKGMNTLFDQLYSDRLDGILSTIEDQAERIRRNFFAIRLIVLGCTVTAIAFLVLQLYRLNRSLRKIAIKTSEELLTTKSHLSEVQGFLNSAQFQQSLFEMVAGLSHELNTPLGNCVSAASYLETQVAAFNEDLAQGSVSRERFARSINENLEGLKLIRGNLDRMKLQIDTFKRLSSVNHEAGGAAIPLGSFIDDVLPDLARDALPGVDFRIKWDRNGNPSIRYSDLMLIFRQLFENAREHAYAKTVTASFRVHEGRLDLIIKDDGIGIPDDMLDKVAEPFFTTARGKNHMGLGLSIIASLVSNKLQGTIDFYHGHPGFRIAMSIPLKNLS